MDITKAASSVDIAVSGLQAESLRLNVISANIANANTSRTDSGLPYRRKDVIFSTVMDSLCGVTSKQVIEDTSTDFNETYLPGHPQADENGWVMMPNVDLPVEMMNLMVASRAYQANASVLNRYQQMVDITLELLR